MTNITQIILCFSLVIVISEAARILAVVPTPSISHQVVFRPLIQELVRRGHDVTIITTDPAFPKGQTPQNLTEIDIHDISYAIWTEAVFSSEITSGKTDDVFHQIKTFFSIIPKILLKQIEHPEIKNIFSNEKQYDLLLLESWVRPALIFSHVLKNVPVILISSFGGFTNNFDLVGAPARPPLMYPNHLRQRIVDVTLWDKIIELFHYYKFERIFSDQEVKDNEILKKVFGPDTPSIREMEKNVQMLFLNVHPIWEVNRPVPPCVVYMGGLHQKPEEELPKIKDEDSAHHSKVPDQHILRDYFEAMLSRFLNKEVIPDYK